jgi:hypothetical protein
MSVLTSRVNALEARHRRVHPPTDAQIIPVLLSPGSIEDDRFEPWLAEQLHCDGAPGCSGTRCMFLLPAKVPEDTR